MTYTNVLERIPPTKIGNVEVLHDEPDKWTRMMAGMRGMGLYREKYVRLLVNGSIMMTDAEFERMTNVQVMQEAHGHCLIGGLGIGLILDPLIERCDSVTVIEINSDVIAAVGPYYPKARIIHADVNTWKPDQKFDTIYFDIWPHFNGDTSADAAKLQRRYRKFLNDGGWMRSWCMIAMRASGRRYR